MSTIDINLAIRDIVDHSVSHLTWYEQACSDFGFKGISQLWEDEPSWYFWSDEIPGAFLLRFVDGEMVEGEGFASLVVHYFPDRSDAGSVSRLSDEELKLFEDDSLYDSESSSPRFEAYNSFLAHFKVAELGVLFDGDKCVKMLSLARTEEWKEESGVFFQMLISIFNFYWKSHHTSEFSLSQEGADVTLLVYDSDSFGVFRQSFGIEEQELRIDTDRRLTERIKHVSHKNYKCSANGACSCH
ncbi:hypothetical protein [Limisalsivibrio acetivorans]|uniref:hypothetical protein n=1 Tax=Limisalsivibrio acetivorans TaxID=1304888 RepID=UPI0003B496BE|nr:hypothetical protein [Limisalsivibrio acetivorans]